MKLTLPFPPATNHLYATRGKFRVLSSRARKYKTDVLKQCQIERVRPFLGNVRVTFDAYRPRKIGDLDGLFKIVFDSLKGSAFIDDKQIVEIAAKRFDDKTNPRVEIEITEI